MINPAEAETVRRIFALYREHGCVRRVKDEADRLGLRTKRSRTANGAERGGTPSRAGTSTDCSRTRFTPAGLRTKVSSTPASIRR